MHYNACMVWLIASLQLAVERQSRIAISSLRTTKTATRAGGFSRGLLFRWIAAMWAEDYEHSYPVSDQCTCCIVTFRRWRDTSILVLEEVQNRW